MFLEHITKITLPVHYADIENSTGSSWQIVARHDVGDLRLDAFFEKIDHGIKYFEQHQDEAVQYISTNLDYSTQDAQAWLATVKFAENTKGVEMETVEKTIGVLEKAGVIEKGVNIEPLVSSA